MATLKAFAVAIRSIALSTDVGGNGFDLYADTRTQVYGGVGIESERTNRAVRATRNQVATYGGEVAQTTYFSSSGGRTESGFLGAPEVPYLAASTTPTTTTRRSTAGASASAGADELAPRRLPQGPPARDQGHSSAATRPASITRS